MDLCYRVTRAFAAAGCDLIDVSTGQTVADAQSIASSLKTERCFSDEEVQAALGAAGFAVELIEPWTPMPDDVPGKTWVVARRS